MKYTLSSINRIIRITELNTILLELKHGNNAKIPFGIFERELPSDNLLVRLIFTCQGYNQDSKTYVRFTNDDRRKFMRLANEIGIELLKGKTPTISFETSLPINVFTIINVL
jgi:hypothetical protein